MKIKKYGKDSVVVVQNADNKGFFYIVKSGLLQVDSEHRLNDKALSHFGPGDSFGLVSALTGHKYLVSVFAAQESEVIEMPVSNLGTFLKSNQGVATSMLKMYCNELKAIHKYLSMVNPVETRHHSPDKLPQQAQEYLGMGRPECAKRALEFFVEWAKNSPEHAVQAKQAAGQLRGLTASEGPDRSGGTLHLKPNDVVFVENELSKDIYVIKSGKIRLSTLARGQELLIDILEPGEIFGEMSFVDDGLRMATAVAQDDAEVMRFSPDTLFASIGDVILQKIFISLARRIWFSHQRLVILRLKDPIERLYAFVYNLIRNFDIIHPQEANKLNYTFNLSMMEMKKMCGLSNMPDAKLEAFTKDTNLVFAEHSVDIKNRKMLEDHINYHKTKIGQISAELV